MLSVKAAGIPNITGIDNPYGIEQSHGSTVLDGAFYRSSSVSARQGYNHESGGAANAIAFDASRCSAIYGSTNTVQPPALDLIPQIKF